MEILYDWLLDLDVTWAHVLWTTLFVLEGAYWTAELVSSLTKRARSGKREPFWPRQMADWPWHLKAVTTITLVSVLLFLLWLLFRFG